MGNKMGVELLDVQNASEQKRAIKGMYNYI